MCKPLRHSLIFPLGVVREGRVSLLTRHGHRSRPQSQVTHLHTPDTPCPVSAVLLTQKTDIPYHRLMTPHELGSSVGNG